MEFQIAKTPVWKKVAAFIGIFLSMVGMGVTFIATTLAGKDCTLGVASFAIAGVLFGLGGAQFYKRTTAVNDAVFSERLMDEYHATSSRSFSSIAEDLYQFNDASTIFSADGKDTQVFVKLVNRGKNPITMVFTVIDAKSLYPKPSK